MLVKGDGGLEHQRGGEEEEAQERAEVSSVARLVRGTFRDKQGPLLKRCKGPGFFGFAFASALQKAQ
jgi:hypothetical protein